MIRAASFDIPNEIINNPESLLFVALTTKKFCIFVWVQSTHRLKTRYWTGDSYESSKAPTFAFHSSCLLVLCSLVFTLIAPDDELSICRFS